MPNRQSGLRGYPMPFPWRWVPPVVLCLGIPTAAAAADTVVRKAPTKPVEAVDRCAKVEPPPGTPVVPSGNIFGFSDPTDLGDPCTWNFASENTGRAGKRDGSYFFLESKNELSYTYTSDIAFAFSAFTTYNRWSNVTVLQDTLATQGDGVFLNRLNRLSFAGLSGEFLVRLVKRAPGQPVAVTAAVEPRWASVDGEAGTGYRADGYAAEFKLLADVALTERLFGAVNLNYALGTQKFDIPNALWERASGTNVSAALTAQIYAAEKQTIEGIFVGVEGRYRTQFEGLLLDRFTGEAFNAGPTLAIAFAGDRMLSLAWSPQVAGGTSPSTPGRLNLDEFERMEFRVKFEMLLGP
jgi:hypothetical protein